MKRSKPLRRGKPLKQRSEKRAKLYREARVPLVVELLRERPWCEVGELLNSIDPKHTCRLRSCDIHERKTRARGGSITDRENLLAVCRPCHNWIGANIHMAEELGLLLHSWDEVEPWDKTKSFLNLKRKNGIQPSSQNP